MEHHLNFLNPANQELDEDDLPLSELEIAQQNAWKEKTKRFRLEEKISTAIAKLTFLEDLFSQTENVFAKNKINEIINDFKL